MMQKRLPRKFINDKKPLEIELILKFRALNFELGKLVIPIVLLQENCLSFPTIKCSVFMTITR